MAKPIITTVTEPTKLSAGQLRVIHISPEAIADNEQRYQQAAGKRFAPPFTVYEVADGKPVPTHYCFGVSGTLRLLASVNGPKYKLPYDADLPSYWVESSGAITLLPQEELVK